MPGSEVKVGPFSGGLNNVSISGEAQDSEVLELINLEVGPDVSLVSRPVITTMNDSQISPSTVGTSKYKVLGVYRPSATEWYLVVVRPISLTQSAAGLYRKGVISDASWQSLKVFNVATDEVSAIAQIDKTVYFCVSSDSAMSGFSWDGTTFKDIPAMKKGFTMVAHKQRLWVAGTTSATNNSRVYFSTIDNIGYKPELWGANDFFDAAVGEGGYITALLTVGSNLLIFKNDGTWRFSYPTRPADGQVSKISGDVGAANANSVLEFENYVYVYDQGRLYELVNSSFTHLNRFCKFSADKGAIDSYAEDVDVSLVNRRIVVRYQNAIYAYAVDTKTWSQWRTYNGVPGKFHELPTDSASAASSIYVAPSRGVIQDSSEEYLDTMNAEYVGYLKATVGPYFTYINTGNTVKISSATEVRVYLNKLDSLLGEMAFPATGMKMYSFSADISKVVGTVKMGVSWLDDKNVQTHVISTTNVPNATTSTPYIYDRESSQNAIAGKVFLDLAAGASITLTNASFKAKLDARSPVSLIQLVDDYYETTLHQEFIYSHVVTKAYDFKAAASFKRLFWWAADIKSVENVRATLIPMSVKAGPTWGDLEDYSWTQLERGTWGNPLLWKAVQLDVKDMADPSNYPTENGRNLIKLIRGIRFKQVSFKLEFRNFGNTATGPTKLHALYAYVAKKQKVVDKVN